jgi:hypothetical protein
LCHGFVMVPIVGWRCNCGIITQAVSSSRVVPAYGGMSVVEYSCWQQLDAWMKISNGLISAIRFDLVKSPTGQWSEVLYLPSN